MTESSIPGAARPRKRSIAWLFYGALAVLAAVGGFNHPSFFITAILLGLYSTYLFRGGRFVIWIW